MRSDDGIRRQSSAMALGPEGPNHLDPAERGRMSGFARGDGPTGRTAPLGVRISGRERRVFAWRDVSKVAQQAHRLVVAQQTVDMTPRRRSRSEPPEQIDHFLGIRPRIDHVPKLDDMPARPTSGLETRIPVACRFDECRTAVHVANGTIRSGVSNSHDDARATGPAATARAASNATPKPTV
jgi:hypothetical protein